MNRENETSAGRRLVKCFIVLAGIILGQVILYGPSLIGWKILLPVDLLAEPGVYLPQADATNGIASHDRMLGDLILQFEPARQFAVSEIHQGRFPLWAPYGYAGAPFIWPKFSVFLLPEYCVKSPVILAWVQLLAALVAGMGMYVFGRRVLRVGFWPAAVCAWCYPLTAFFVLWQGFPPELTVYWLPWLFLAVEKTLQSSGSLPVIGLSAVTFLVLTTGNIDIAGQALLGCLFFAIWRLGSLQLGHKFPGKLQNVMAKLAIGWALGFMLAAPQMLPLIAYAQTGSRLEHRSAGAEERPPVGLAALPQTVLPDIYGTTENGSCFIGPATETNLMESPSAAYAGIFATLLVAPLAWCDRRRFALNAFWLFLAFFGVSWCLNVPGIVTLLRLPGLNMMSHNRLVFLTAFAVLSLTAIGLENLATQAVQRRWWFWLPAALLAGLCGWCFYRSRVLPEPVATQIEQAVLQCRPWQTIHTIQGVHAVQGWFIQHYTVSAVFCGLGFVGWLLLWFSKGRTIHRLPWLMILLPADLLWFGCGRSAQCDPALYYPKIPALAAVARSAPGRIVGIKCLPPSVVAGEGLNDIRGYDAVDPARMVALLKKTAAPGREPPYAITQFLLPAGKITAPGNIRLSPILNLLNVRYVIFRGAPPPDIHPPFQSPDYWVLINSNALPRVFVPKSVEVVANSQAELSKLSAPEFHPRDVAYVESPVHLPASARGTAQITGEIPTRVTIALHMETPGLVVLADRWDEGWHARYNGRPVPILETDYAIRGVVVPAGSGTLVFFYRPASLVLGLWLAGFGGIILLGWLAVIWLRKPKGAGP